MGSLAFWFLLLQSLVHYLRPVGDGLDEAMRLRMEARAMSQEVEKILLEWEVEQLTLKQSRGAWRELLWSALQDWQIWAIAGLLLLLSAPWFIWRERSLRREEHEEENNGINEEEVRNVEANEEEAVGNEEEDNNDANREEDNNDDGNGEEVSDGAANEDGAGNEVVIAAANAENNNNDVREAEEGEHDIEDYTGRILMERIQWPVQDLQKGCEWTTDLMANFTIYFGHILSGSFYPVLQRAIGVGSAFEGWSPREQDVVYRVLVPMTPPRGHTFHLERDTEEQRHVRNFRVRVQLECTCTREQQGENMLCFLHHPEEELRRNQDPSLLHTLCTGTYLDVQKTARWFYQLVRAIWPALPQSHTWRLVLLPSKRSCQFQVTKGRESFRIEVLFGVRQGDLDIFVSSQPRQACTPSTTWPETYAVAEVKFFKYIARQAPPDSLHLKCLQFFTRLQLGLGISTYTTKTIVMHLLNIIPVSRWRRRDFVRRLVDISEDLRLCVEVRRLNHFILGNRRLPGEISLPPEVQMAKTCNLFHHLVMDPAAHSQAMSEYVDLRMWLVEMLESIP
ncbi:inositol 1,4,5-trisphosphate receptor-interacting protein-like 1 [Corvus moneduloides]|uniref:inositol 1,4,5-trisphosphate receptor-interacting protein-like 1 n=1 Tax=Corvus moneduloides TaxID=1196302 RepID=UPI0013630122|nr:inositol 1,4,5-trisphosphate receptor-interacting protein-like 1 [Corvus moneduloides]